ncbi:MAG: hypothetical protein DI597_11830 [Pseudoxanthomonas spadix]|nr:MAG: hypothetical protein DI597_11830 [Pseudoxanthomonas spadix]
MPQAIAWRASWLDMRPSSSMVWTCVALQASMGRSLGTVFFRAHAASGQSSYGANAMARTSPADRPQTRGFRVIQGLGEALIL